MGSFELLDNPAPKEKWLLLFLELLSNRGPVGIKKVLTRRKKVFIILNLVGKKVLGR